MGDVPFTMFENPLLPHPCGYPGDNVLVQRVLFKVEAWSAPDIGGIARGFFSGDQKGWTTKPKLVLDFADNLPPCLSRRRRAAGRFGNKRGTRDAQKYRGRGLVQITGKDNYEKLSTLLKRAKRYAEVLSKGGLWKKLFEPAPAPANGSGLASGWGLGAFPMP